MPAHRLGHRQGCETVVLIANRLAQAQRNTGAQLLTQLAEAGGQVGPQFAPCRLSSSQALGAVRHALKQPARARPAASPAIDDDLGSGWAVSGVNACDSARFGPFFATGRAMRC